MPSSNILSSFGSETAAEIGNNNEITDIDETVEVDDRLPLPVNFGIPNKHTLPKFELRRSLTEVKIIIFYTNYYVVRM